MLKLIHAVDMNLNSVKEYYDSFENPWREIGCYAITKINSSEEEYLRYLFEDEKHLYYLIDDNNPNYIIGFGSIEDSYILDYHKSYLNEGNIGYGVRINERNKGYGTEILRLLLLKCEELGMKEVCVSCHEQNVASKKIIERNRGIFEKRWADDWSGKYALKYWIKLHPNIDNKIKILMYIHQKKKVNP